MSLRRGVPVTGFAAMVIKSAASANGIITFLINLPNLPHLFLLLYTSSSEFLSVCVQPGLRQTPDG